MQLPPSLVARIDHPIVSVLILGHPTLADGFVGYLFPYARPPDAEVCRIERLRKLVIHVFGWSWTSGHHGFAFRFEGGSGLGGWKSSDEE